MFRSINRRTLVYAWLGALVAVAGAGLLLGASLTITTILLWLFACVAPPAVMLMVWTGAPPATVAEILHSVDRRE